MNRPTSNVAAILPDDQEQKLRRSFQDTVKFFGLRYAEGVFSPDDFARLSQLLNPNNQSK